MAVKVSIVIVSWNVRELLLDCIRPFYHHNNVQIIVVDNNSSDDTVEVLKSDYPRLCLLANKNNPGFAQGNNQGFEHCQGEYIYILNPDTVSSYEGLMKLVEVLDANSAVGGVSPKIRYGNGRIQNSCARRFPSLRSHVLINILRFHRLPIVGKHLLHHLKYPYNYETSGYIEACSGAAYLVRRKILDETGGFNPNFLHTGEDVELMGRVVEAGYKNYFCAESELTHLAGQSSKQNIARVQVNVFLSGWYYHRLRKGKFHAFLYRLYTLTLDMPLRGIRVIVKLVMMRKEAVKDYKDYRKMWRGVWRWKPIT